MKKLFFLVVFFSISTLTFSANVYFLNDGPGYIYTNGQTFYSNQDGYAPIAYHIWADPSRYTVTEWGANFQDPDGNWSDWSHLSSGLGLHHCLKAGTWHVQGRVWVEHDIFGYGHYWMETSFTLYFYVVDNTAPSAPQNLSVAGDADYHPHLTWDTNPEEDVYANTTDGYLIERRLWSNGSGTWTNWTQIATTSGQTNAYTDPDIDNASGAGPGIAAYRLRAKDINGNISGYSSVVSIGYGISPEKIVIQYNVFTNLLEQNYPNPFNPTTSISYCLEKPGFVKLVVYNLLGQEVAELVTESQARGYHTVNFNAANLPSGIYVYKLNTSKFTEIKKMQLIK